MNLDVPMSEMGRLRDPPRPARVARFDAGAGAGDAVAPQLPPLARWRHPLDAATADLALRLGVVYAEDDGWAKDAAAKELMEK